MFESANCVAISGRQLCATEEPLGLIFTEKKAMRTAKELFGEINFCSQTKQ